MECKRKNKDKFYLNQNNFNEFKDKEKERQNDKITERQKDWKKEVLDLWYFDQTILLITPKAKLIKVVETLQTFLLSKSHPSWHYCYFSISSILVRV